MRSNPNPEEAELRNVKGVLKVVSRKKRILQKASELTRAMHLVYGLQPKIVVEIGSYRGWNMWALSYMILQPAELISIDPLCDSGADPYRFTYESGEVAERMKPHKFNWIDEYSTKPAALTKLKKILNGRTIDLLYIDGDHTYEGVKQDFEIYSPLVKGMIMFHDDGPNPSRSKGCEVEKYISEEISPNYPYFRILAPSRSCGIGVIMK